MNTLKEREDAIVNGIISGNNACGTLRDKVIKNDGIEDYVRDMVSPTLMVYEDEIAALRLQRDSALEELNKQTRLNEFILANVSIPEHVKQAAAPIIGRPL